MVALVGSMALFAASFTLTKIAYRDLGPFTLGFLRFGLAALLLTGWFAVTRSGQRVAREDRGKFVLGGLLGVTGYFALENLGVQWSTATDAALLGAAYPAIIVAVDVLLRKTRVGRRTWGGIVLAMIGAAGIVAGAPQDPTNAPLRLWGDVLILGSAVMWAFYTYATRDVVKHYSPFTTVLRQDAVGAVAFIPLVAIEAPTWRAPTAPVTTALAVVALTVLCSIFAMALYAQGMRHLPTATVAASINLMPLFGLVIAAAVLHESVSMVQLASCAVVIAGVWLSTEVEPEAAEHPVG